MAWAGAFHSKRSLDVTRTSSPGRVPTKGLNMTSHTTISPEEAAKLVAVGESRPDPAIPPAKLAPWMLIASTALNLDATLNK